MSLQDEIAIAQRVNSSELNFNDYVKKFEEAMFILGGSVANYSDKGDFGKLDIDLARILTTIYGMARNAGIDLDSAVLKTLQFSDIKPDVFNPYRYDLRYLDYKKYREENKIPDDYLVSEAVLNISEARCAERIDDMPIELRVNNYNFKYCLKCFIQLTGNYCVCGNKDKDEYALINESFYVYVVTKNLSRYPFEPIEYTCRKHLLSKGRKYPTPTEEYLKSIDIEIIHNMIPDHFIRMPRTSCDHTAIIESWI